VTLLQPFGRLLAQHPFDPLFRAPRQIVRLVEAGRNALEPFGLSPVTLDREKPAGKGFTPCVGSSNRGSGS
jgi:hypothetical protein